MRVKSASIACRLRWVMLLLSRKLAVYYTQRFARKLDSAWRTLHRVFHLSAVTISGLAASEVKGLAKGLITQQWLRP
jgi:hypothetical protein